MGYISQEVYDYHIKRAWKKRKQATTKRDQSYWNKVIHDLKTDLNGTGSLWLFSP